MDERYIDLIKMIWNEMNPLDGYSSRRTDIKFNNTSGKNDKKFYSYIMRNNLEDILELDFDNQVYKKFDKGFENQRRVNFPKNTGEWFGDGMWRSVKVPHEYVKDINNKWDVVLNRIPTKSLGKIINKVLNEPVVRTGGNVINKTVVPLSILEGIGLNQPVY